MKLWHHRAVEYRKRISLKRFRRKLSERKSKRRLGVIDATTIKACENFEVLQPQKRMIFLSFIHRLRDSFARPDQCLHIDFTPVKRIESLAGLLLWSELDSLCAKYPRKKISASRPRRNKCHQVLCKIGVSQLCNLPRTPTKDGDVIHWNAANSEVVDGELYSRKLIEPFDDQLPESLREQLWRSVQEAMANIPEHAYSAPRFPGSSIEHSYLQKWWMFSQIKDNQLTIIINDLGVGIPNTLSSKSTEQLVPHLRAVSRWLRRGPKSDSEVLAAVMKKSASGYPKAGQTLSRTGKDYRGRGIYNILQLIQEVPRSYIIVLSNKGLWRKSLSSPPISHEYKDSIYGTIISWIIPLTPD